MNQMLICTECSAVFSKDETRIFHEKYPYGMGYVTEEIHCCPRCNSSDIEQAIKCNRCDSYISKDEYKLDDNLNYICENCYAELYD